MKNLVAISLGPNTQSASKDPAQRESLPPYGRHYEPARAVSERLRHRLELAGVSCGEGGAGGKAFGWDFLVTAKGRQFIVAVCPDQIPLPHTSMTITAQPVIAFRDRLFRNRRRAVEDQNWSYLQPLFTDAVNTEFEDCEPKWMTVDEWLRTIQHEHSA